MAGRAIITIVNVWPGCLGNIQHCIVAARIFLIHGIWSGF